MNIVHRAYAVLPPGLQNAAISLWGVHSRLQRYGKHFHRSLDELRVSEWWSAERIEAYQRSRLAEVLAAAEAHVPFYRERFRAAGVKAKDFTQLGDLSKFPILTKAEAREHASELRDERYPDDKVRFATTSGTTGSPLKIALTPEAQQFVWAVAWRHRARFGLKLGDPFVTFGARLPVLSAEPSPPLWRYNMAIRQAYLSISHLTPANMGIVVDWLNRHRFAFFAGYPSAMYVLACFMLDRGLRLRRPPRVVASASETLRPDHREKIEKAFEAPTTELYGMGEGVGGYSRCERGGFHLDFEHGVVELLPVDGEPEIRRVVITGLGNAAMPFVRYDSGDLARISNMPCPCGRASPCIDAIDGRTEDCIRTPDGRRVVGVNQIFKWASHLREAQVVQRRDDAVEVRMVVGPGFDKRDEEVLRREFGARLGPHVAVTLTRVDAIPRGANGKMRAVVVEPSLDPR